MIFFLLQLYCAATPKRFVMERLVTKTYVLNLKRCLVKSYGEWVDFVYWWSCIGKGLHAACKAGLFFFYTTKVETTTKITEEKSKIATKPNQQQNSASEFKQALNLPCYSFT